jgi:carbonic anhydrase
MASSAALEYAVQVCASRHIVVLGHGPVRRHPRLHRRHRSAVAGRFIGRWMAMFIKPGEKVGQREHETRQDFTTRIEKAAVFRSSKT